MIICFEQFLAADTTFQVWDSVHHIMVMGEAVSQREGENGRQQRTRRSERGVRWREWHTHTHPRGTERTGRKKDSEDRDSPNWIRASTHSPFKDTFQPTSLLSGLISPKPVLVWCHPSLGAAEQSINSFARYTSHHLPPVFPNTTLQDTSWLPHTLAVLFYFLSPDSPDLSRYLSICTGGFLSLRIPSLLLPLETFCIFSEPAQKSPSLWDFPILSQQSQLFCHLSPYLRSSICHSIWVTFSSWLPHVSGG